MRIDRQRISAVQLLQSLGYGFDGVDWTTPPSHQPAQPESDAMHAKLVERCDQPAGCTDGSPEERERGALALETAG